jgi:hypothetical protein
MIRAQPVASGTLGERHDIVNHDYKCQNKLERHSGVEPPGAGTEC